MELFESNEGSRFLVNTVGGIMPGDDLRKQWQWVNWETLLGKRITHKRQYHTYLLPLGKGGRNNGVVRERF